VAVVNLQCSLCCCSLVHNVWSATRNHQGKHVLQSDASCVFTMAMKRRGERRSDKEKERERKTRIGLDRAQERKQERIFLRSYATQVAQHKRAQSVTQSVCSGPLTVHSLQ